MLKFPQTEFAKRLQLTHPVLQAPLPYQPRTPKLLAAMAKAGGVGCLGAKDLPADQLSIVLEELRTKGVWPYGVHLVGNGTPASFTEQLESALDAHVPMLLLEGVLPPEPLLRRFRLQKTVLVGVSATQRGLANLWEYNLDFLVYLGSLNRSPRETPELITLFRKSPIPLLAAAPFFHTSSLLEWLALGATGVQAGLPYHRLPLPSLQTADPLPRPKVPALIRV